MSEIKSKLLEDIKSAMKAREQEKLLTLRSLSAELKKAEVDTRKDLTDADVVAIIQREIKKRRDSLEFAKTANRDDLIKADETEIKIYLSYLGEQLDESKLKELISKMIADGHNNIGKIMSELNQQYKGKFEGKIASEIAKSLLG